MVSSTEVFLDTEFHDDGREIHLISLGLVAETGAEYYAVSADVDLETVLNHDWLSTNVAPHLPIKRGATSWEWDRSHPEFGAVKPRATIATEVLGYFAGLTDPQVWAYFSPFDTIVLTQLYGPLGDLPDTVPGLTQDLLQEARRRATDLPQQPPPIHHALHDARHDLVVAAAIGLLAEPPKRTPAPQ